MTELKTILISVGTWIGVMFLRKIFNDTFKNVDLNIKKVWKTTKIVLTSIVLYTLLVVKPQKAQLVALVLLSTVLLALYLKNKKDKEEKAISMG